jgi:hypothetical protein
LATGKPGAGGQLASLATRRRRCQRWRDRSCAASPPGKTTAASCNKLTAWACSRLRVIPMDSEQERVVGKGKAKRYSRASVIAGDQSQGGHRRWSPRLLESEGFWKARAQVYPPRASSALVGTRRLVSSTSSSRDSNPKRRISGLQSGPPRRARLPRRRSTTASIPIRSANSQGHRVLGQSSHRVSRRARHLRPMRAEHGTPFRTTTPIESTFATVRRRHRRTKGNGLRAACLPVDLPENLAGVCDFTKRRKYKPLYTRD